VPKVEKVAFDEEESPEKNELYLQATLSTIEKVKQNGFRYKDIVILTRKKAHGTLVANYLTENGVPIISSESLLLGASSEVQGVIHILRYLKNNSDLVAKAHFLYFLASQQNQLETHDFIAQGMEQKAETRFQQWLIGFNIDFSFQNIRKKSLYEATEIIIAKVIPMDKRNAYIQFFLDLILEHDLKKQAGISDFLSYWDNHSEKLSIPSPEGNDAVRIMTIHKSKGLEFPVVIFPFAEEDYSKGPREKMWLNAEEAITGLPKALVDKSSKVEGYGEEASLVYQQKKQEELLDNINVLYVALTRAEEQLYIISGMQSRGKTSGEYPNNMATFFIKFLEDKGFDENKFDYSFGKAEKLSVTKEIINETETIPQLSATLNPKNIKIAQKESLMWNTHQQKAIEFGNILHEILSFVKTKDDIDLALIKAIENGLIIVSQKEEVAQTLNQVVNHPDLLSYFANGNKILNEKTIIQKEGRLVKPDRMVINSNHEIFLLDYKTGTHQAKYIAQLENYQNAIEKMGFKVTKKALVYIGESLEIVNL
jgi:ATP-dependent exoDNAse (exonuclease V) beta subunit